MRAVYSFLEKLDASFMLFIRYCVFYKFVLEVYIPYITSLTRLYVGCDLDKKKRGLDISSWLMLTTSNLGYNIKKSCARVTSEPSYTGYGN